MASARSMGLTVRGLSKTFKGSRPLREILLRPLDRRLVTALSDVSFDAAPGEVVGVVGPNGAGKTTLVKILAGLVLPDEGEAAVLDHAAGSVEARKLTGLVTAEERSFFWRISARENLRFFASLHGLHRRAADDRIGELAETLEIRVVLDSPVRELSSGNRGRLALARGMLHEPKLLLLDEVARALDPGASRRLRRLLRRLADQNDLTILYAIHDLEEVRRLCDRVVLLDKGQVMVAGSYSHAEPMIREVFSLEPEDVPSLPDRFSRERTWRKTREPDLKGSSS